MVVVTLDVPHLRLCCRGLGQFSDNSWTFCDLFRHFVIIQIFSGLSNDLPVAGLLQVKSAQISAKLRLSVEIPRDFACDSNIAGD